MQDEETTGVPLDAMMDWAWTVIIAAVGTFGLIGLAVWRAL